MKNIDLVIQEIENSTDNFYSEHMDYFFDQSVFTYEDCILLMKEIRYQLNSSTIQTAKDWKIMIRIVCGSSTSIQIWGNQFWKLVDASLTPPEIFIWDKKSVQFGDPIEQIYKNDDDRQIVNNIVFYKSDNEYSRCLEMTEKGG